jgi:hypothetical protein
MPSDTNIAYLSLEIEAGNKVLFTRDRSGRYTSWLERDGETLGIGREDVTKDEVELLVRDFPRDVSVEN